MENKKLYQGNLDSEKTRNDERAKGIGRTIDKALKVATIGTILFSASFFSEGIVNYIGKNENARMAQEYQTSIHDIGRIGEDCLGVYSLYEKIF